jgi:hypothetical protein
MIPTIKQFFLYLKSAGDKAGTPAGNKTRRHTGNSNLFPDIKELNCPSYFFLLTVMHLQTLLQMLRGRLSSGDKK